MTRLSVAIALLALVIATAAGVATSVDMMTHEEPPGSKLPQGICWTGEVAMQPVLDRSGAVVCYEGSFVSIVPEPIEGTGP